jgi:hypothetical protein
MDLGKISSNTIPMVMCEFKYNVICPMMDDKIYIDNYMLIRHSVEIESYNIVEIMNQIIRR